MGVEVAAGGGAVLAVGLALGGADGVAVLVGAADSGEDVALGAVAGRACHRGFLLRPGNAGSNTAADHIEVLGQAIAQIPAAHRREVLIRSDGAGASHDLLEWITEQNRVRGRRVEYSVGFSITAPIRRAIATCPEVAWGPALNPSGDIRDGAEVAELTGFLAPGMLAKWPDGMRVIVRRERPHPGAQLSMFEELDGWRYQAFVTNTRTGQLQFLEARHRAHARVEDRISDTPKTLGWAVCLRGNSRPTRPGWWR
ncbi:transposase [Gordonia lacunae]